MPAHVPLPTRVSDQPRLLRKLLAIALETGVYLAFLAVIVAISCVLAPLVLDMGTHTSPTYSTLNVSPTSR